MHPAIIKKWDRFLFKFHLCKSLSFARNIISAAWHSSGQRSEMISGLKVILMSWLNLSSGHIPGFDFFLIEAELSLLLGRKVDLQTENFISPEIRRSILSEAVSAYEQA
jgi:hypothetical protein